MNAHAAHHVTFHGIYLSVDVLYEDTVGQFHVRNGGCGAFYDGIQLLTVVGWIQ
jgi:hypothetical protein